MTTCISNTARSLDDLVILQATLELEQDDPQELPDGPEAGILQGSPAWHQCRRVFRIRGDAGGRGIGRPD